MPVFQIQTFAIFIALRLEMIANKITKLHSILCLSIISTRLTHINHRHFHIAWKWGNLQLHVCICVLAVACLQLHACSCMFAVAFLQLHVCSSHSCLHLHACSPQSSDIPNFSARNRTLGKPLSFFHSWQDFQLAVISDLKMHGLLGSR